MRQDDSSTMTVIQNNPESYVKLLIILSGAIIMRERAEHAVSLIPTEIALGGLACALILSLMTASIQGIRTVQKK